MVPHFETQAGTTPLIQLTGELYEKRSLTLMLPVNLDKRRRTSEKLQTTHPPHIEYFSGSWDHFHEMLSRCRHLDRGTISADDIPTGEDPLPAQEASSNPILTMCSPVTGRENTTKIGRCTTWNIHGILGEGNEVHSLSWAHLVSLFRPPGAAVSCSR